MSSRGLDLTTVVFVRECTAEVLRWIGTDVMAVVPLVNALLAAPVVRSRRDQTDAS